MTGGQAKSRTAMLPDAQEFGKSRAEALIARRASEKAKAEELDKKAEALRRELPLRFESLRNTVRDQVEGFNACLPKPELSYSEGTNIAAIAGKACKTVFTYDPGTASLKVVGNTTVVYPGAIDGSSVYFADPTTGLPVTESNISGSVIDELVSQL